MHVACLHVLESTVLSHLEAEWHCKYGSQQVLTNVHYSKAMCGPGQDPGYCLPGYKCVLDLTGHYHPGHVNGYCCPLRELVTLSSSPTNLAMCRRTQYYCLPYNTSTLCYAAVVHVRLCVIRVIMTSEDNINCQMCLS